MPYRGAGTGDIGARVYNSGDISVNDSTATLLTFDSERWDTDTIHSTVANTGRLTATTAGTYLIVANIRFYVDNDGYRMLTFTVDGATDIAKTRIEATQGTYTELNLVTMHQFAAAEYVEVYAYHNAGNALDVKAQGNLSPEFMMHRIGA